MALEDFGQKLNALILCKSPQRRNLLQQGIGDAKCFENLKHCQSVEDLEIRIKEFDSWHLVLIAPEFSNSQITSVVSKIRKSPQANFSAVVLILDEAKDSKNKLNEDEVEFDSYLTPPFTMDSFKDLASFSSRIYKERGKAKLIEFYHQGLNRFMEQLNLVALNIKLDNSQALGNLKRLRNLALKINNEDQKVYLNVLVDLMTDPNRYPRKGRYLGASTRLRKKYEKQLTDELLG